MSKASKTRGAVIYTRVSTDEQAEHGTSLESQRDACRKKALALGLPIIAEYEDAGVSGAFYTSRPGVQAALADIEAGRASVLICYELSRLSRVVLHQQDIQNRVLTAGGTLVFCDITFEPSAAGRLNFTIQGGFKEYEREIIRERTMTGRRRRAEEGIQTARSWSPFGYVLVNKAHVIRGEYEASMLGQYVVKEDEAEVVRWLFAEYGAGNYSLPGLVRELNQRGVPTKQGAAAWHPPTVRAIFLNEVYIGKPKYGKMTCRKDESRRQQVRESTGEFFKSAEVRRPSDPASIVELSAPPLVDMATWNAVQERLKTNKARRGGNPCRTHMLSGTVRCEVCGGPMYLNGGRSLRGKGNYPYYSCGRYRHALAYTREPECVADAYKADVAEASVTLAVEALVLHPDWVKEAQAEYKRLGAMAAGGEGVGQRDARKERAAVEKALRDLQDEEAAAVKAQIAGVMHGASPDAYAEVFADIAARRKDLEERRGSLARVAKENQAANNQAGSGMVQQGTAQTLEDDAAVTLEEARLRLLEETHRVLTSPYVTGLEKRQLVMQIIAHVHCKKDGAHVFFRPEVAVDWADDTLRDTLQHVLKSLLLNTKNQVIGAKTVSVGDLSSSIVHPREVFK